MTTMTPEEQVMWVKCECGKMMRRYRMKLHRPKCKAVPKVMAHCKFCSKESIQAIYVRLKAGEMPDLVAKALDVSLAYVFECRARGRKRGCLPIATPEQIVAEREQMGLLRFGRRTCSECNGEFIPKINNPNQWTCGAEACMKKRHAKAANERMRQHKNDPDEDLLHMDPTTQEKAEEQMSPLRREEAWLRAECDRMGRWIESNREHSFVLSMSLFGVAL
jgi:hypothetical protein